MNYRITYILIAAALIVFFIAIYCYDNFFTIDMIAGKYIHKNFKSSHISVMRVTPDTLILYKNGTFIGADLGTGTYKLLRSIGGTEISISYKDDYGDGSINSQLNRSGFTGLVKLMIDYDRNEHYLKIEDLNK